jgi:hypothetical protein
MAFGQDIRLWLRRQPRHRHLRCLQGLRSSHRSGDRFVSVERYSTIKYQANVPVSGRALAASYRSSRIQNRASACAVVDFHRQYHHRLYIACDM